MTSVDPKFTPPSRAAADHGHIIVTAGLSAIPVVGGPAAELFAAYVVPPLERRRDEWMRDIGIAFAELQSRVGALDSKIAAHEEFVDVAVRLSQSATRTTDPQKLEALRNALMNSALYIEPNAEYEMLYARLIDEVTPLQLQMLALFADPEGWARARNHTFPDLFAGSRAQILESAMPHLIGKAELYNQLWRDLFARGLVGSEGLQGTMTGTGLLEPCLTRLGRRFLQFVSPPRPVAS